MKTLIAGPLADRGLSFLHEVPYPGAMNPENQLFYRRNRGGLIEAVDMTTNRVVAVQHSLQTLSRNEMVEIILPDGRTVLMEATLRVKGDALSAYFPDQKFNPILADLIVDEVVGGASLLKACLAVGVEYTIVNKWKTEDDIFRGRLDQARRDRAEYHHDKILEIAAGSRDPKIEIDALKWSTEKNDPEKFSAKTKISGDKNNPVQFVLATGIDRTPEPAAEKEVTPPERSTLPPGETQALDYGIVATNDVPAPLAMDFSNNPAPKDRYGS